MRYDYSNIKSSCDRLGLLWFGDDYADQFALKADVAGFTQAQFDVAATQAMVHVTTIFTPQAYSWKNRILLALHFIFGKAPQQRSK